MNINVTDWTWAQLCAINDVAFHNALMRSEFSREVGQNRQRQINVYWLYPWAYSDECGNRRFSVVAAAIRAAWPDHEFFNLQIFLQVARERRYLGL
ncbi:MAG: hypothetical protein FWB86_02775 [Treponema sp.]|nr:hypothetical protein [Treponema sp.]MCL2251694.1 hypothetical protein [Treponema sp.]